MWTVDIEYSWENLSNNHSDKLSESNPKAVNITFINHYNNMKIFSSYYWKH